MSSLRKIIAVLTLGTLFSSFVPFALAQDATTPSIVITSPTLGTSSEDGAVTFSFEVDGVTVDATADHVHYYLDGGSVVMVYTTDSIPLTELAEGDHTLMAVVADANHGEYTNDEATDTVTFTVEYPTVTYPDLAVLDMYANEDGHLAVELANLGDSDVSTDPEIYVDVYIDGVLDTQYASTVLTERDFLDAGGSSVITFGAMEGSHTYEVVIDSQGVLEESDETNNSLSMDLSVEYPDLAYVDSYLNEDFVLVLEFTNQGNVDVDSQTEVEIEVFIDDVLEWTLSSFDLDKGFLQVGQTSLIEVDYLSGTHSVLFCVDTDDAVAELNEDNNCGRLDLDEGLPDLKIESIEYDSDTGMVSVVIKNDSDVPFAITTGFRTVVWIDDVLTSYSGADLSDESVAEARGSSTLTFAASPGEYVEVYVDYFEFVVEEDETNNEADLYIATDVTIPEGDDTYVDQYVIEDPLEIDSEEVHPLDSADFIQALPEDVFAEFEELWTDTKYSDIVYLTVRHGHFGTHDETLMLNPTIWDGSVNFGDSVVGRPIYLLRYEANEDSLDYDNLNPTMTPFFSSIYGANDGIAFKLKADLEADPYVSFISDYLGTDIDVTLEELLSVDEYVYSVDDNYDVIFEAWTRDEWQERLEDVALLYVLIGNVDGEGSAGDDAHTYSVSMTISEGMVRGYLPVLLEDHTDDLDGYDQFTRNADKDGVTLESAILGHTDGFFTLLDLLESEDGDKSIDISVVDNATGTVVFEQTFTQDDEFGTFELNDGTGNKIIVHNKFRYLADYAESAEAVFGLLHAWNATSSRLIAVLEDILDTRAVDSEVETMIYDLIDELLALIPGEEAETSLGLLQSDVINLRLSFGLVLHRYEQGEYTDTEFSDAVRLLLEGGEIDLSGVLIDSGFYPDVNYGAWYASFMGIASGDLELFTGYNDGEMRPSAQLTRFQLLKVAYRLAEELGLGVGTTDCDPETVSFTDVDWMMNDEGEYHWGSGFVQCILDSGFEVSLLEEVIQEDRDLGKDPALRFEAVVTVMQFLDIVPEHFETYSLDLEDSGLDSEYLDYFETAIQLGIISGHDDGTARLFDPVNRAQMFKIVSLFYEVYSL